MVPPRFSLMDASESSAYLLHMSFCCCIDGLTVKFLLRPEYIVQKISAHIIFCKRYPYSLSLSFQIVSTALIRIFSIEIFAADAMVIRGYTLILNNSTELSVQSIIGQHRTKK